MSESTYWIWLVPVIPLLAAPFSLYLGKKLPYKGSEITIIAMVISLILSIVNLREVLLAGTALNSGFYTLKWLSINVPMFGNFAMPLGWINDPLAAWMLIIVCFVSLMVQIYSTGYMAHDEPMRNHIFFFELSLFTASMLILVLANNLVTMYMAWELVGLCSYLLIGFWFFKPSAASASKKAFLVTRVGDFGFLLGILVLFTFTQQHFGKGLLGFQDLFGLVEADKIPISVLTIATLLIFCGAVGKSAQFPLHVWLPDAMEGPTPVSALIHAATMVAAGVYLVARCYPMFSPCPITMETVAWIGAVSAFIPATIAMVNNNIKRVMAYSTISQLGFMMLALGCGGYGYVAGMFHLSTHAFFKALLFLCAGSVIHAVHSEEMNDMGKLFKHMPITAVTCLIGGLSLAGVPPFAGFFSKDEVMLNVWASGHTVLFWFASLTVMLTAFYTTRMFIRTFFGQQTAKGHPHESPLTMTIPLILLAVLALIAGFPKESFHRLLPWHAETPHHSSLVMFICTGSAVAGIALGYIMYQAKLISAEAIANRFKPLYNFLFNKWLFDELYQNTFIRSTLFLARVSNWIDKYIIDGLVNLIADLCMYTGWALKFIQNGLTQTYAMIFFAGIGLIFILWRIIG